MTTIVQLTRELGFMDARPLSKMLSQAWSVTFPGTRFADVSDAEIKNIADEFLKEKGRAIWSQDRRGAPVYPDDKDTILKPKIVAILKRQRQSQLDVRNRRMRKLQEDEDEEDEGYSDDSLESSEASRYHSRPRDHVLRAPSGQLMPSSDQLLIPMALVPGGPIQARVSGTTEGLTTKDLLAAAVNPRKRPFEEMSGMDMHGLGGQSQIATAHERATPENTPLAQKPYVGSHQAGHHPLPPFPFPTQPSNKSLPAESTNINSPASWPANQVNSNNLVIDGEGRSVAQQHSLVQRMGRASDLTLQSRVRTVSTPALRGQSPQVGKDRLNGLVVHELQKPGGETEREVSGSNPKAGTEPERISWLSLDQSYSIEADNAPHLLQWVLDYCEEQKTVNAKAMREATAADDKAQARIKFLLLRDLMNAFKAEGLLVGARREF